MSNLILVQADRQIERVRRQGRFAVEREASGSPQHLEAAVKIAQERMIEGLGKKGFEYVDEGFTLEGPLEHLIFTDDVTPDPNQVDRPHPLDLAAQERWERAEKARTAKKLGEMVEYVDFMLHATFEVTPRAYFNVVGGSGVWTP